MRDFKVVEQNTKKKYNPVPHEYYYTYSGFILLEVN